MQICPDAFGPKQLNLWVMKITVQLSPCVATPNPASPPDAPGPGRPAERTRVISKRVIVAMIPAPPAIGIDRPRVIASGERVFGTNGSRRGFLTSNVGA